MRILKTISLSFFLIAAAPVLVGLGVNADSASEPSLRETVVGKTAETVLVKTAPDGTWPFAVKSSARNETSSSWI